MRTIVRVEHNKDMPFVMVAKTTIKDKSLDFELLGFLVYLLAKPDDWQIRPEQLAKEIGLSAAKVYRLIKRLTGAGFIRRTDFKRTVSGRFEGACLYTVYESKEEAKLNDVPF